MASILTHYLIAEKYNEKYKSYKKEDLISFLVGAIAADTPNGLGKGLKEREDSHFGSSPSMKLIEKGNFNLNGDILNYDSFIKKYKGQLNNPFVLGYLLHLYTDKKWFKEVIKRLLDKNASNIKETATTSYDLSFKEAILWYTKNLYQTYDVHDILFYKFLNLEHINQMSNYNVNDCPIEEVNKEDLKRLLEKIKIKCENLRNKTILDNSDILISSDNILSFIDECAAKFSKSYFKN